MKHRLFNRIYAWYFHYFWLPCPICGQMFGGHEWTSYGGLSSTIYNDWDNPTLGKAICPDCTRDGRGSNNPLFIITSREMEAQKV
jgi:hypothetical protein